MSSVPAISVEQLGKRYLLGHQARPDTLRDSLAEGARGLLRRWLRGAAREEREEFWALRDVSFDVARGEVVGIIGRNGAGKSTLLKVLSRITEPTSGRAVIRGRVASLLEVGTGFHPELSGRENIFLNGAILGMTRAEIAGKFDEIVAFAEIERFLDTPVKHYSSGMYVRLAFAVAAHLEPEILIVDEVLAVGDAAFQKKCLGKMDAVARHEGRTILFVSHNEAAVAAMCGRVALLESGRLVAFGGVADVLQRYRSSWQEALALRIATPWLAWAGLLNRSELEARRGGEDMEFRFRLRGGTRSLADVEIDCALVNERGEMVVHSRSRHLAQTHRIPANVAVDVVYRVRQPNLAPGNYSLTVYVRDREQELLWVDDIPACRVLPTSALFPEVPYLGDARGATLPAFTLRLESAPEAAAS